jgi:exonuclease III
MLGGIMSKAFSVVSWNVKHFKGDLSRVEKVVGFLKKQDPDVIGLYEVEGKNIYQAMTNSFPGYTFQITEGQQTQEILVGFRSPLSVFITQRTEFKSGTTNMRPGQLVSISLDGVNYSLLFLHLASSSEPRGMGLRDDMLYKAVKFRHVLDKAVGQKHQSKYIFLGDLNTMGMEYPFNKDIEPKLELEKWDKRASQYYGMHRLRKSHDKTWSGGEDSIYQDSDIDHVYASENIKFTQFNGADVDVRGWVNAITDEEKYKWINDYSDHSILYFEVLNI